jgi:hypothetical protein
MGEIKAISYKEAVEFLLPRHYSGRKPVVSFAFGWYFNGELKAVCTFGKPASPSLCIGICGREYSASVLELNRACRTDDLIYPMSLFVSHCLRQLKNKNVIVVSYSDTEMNHHGYIYQACNFLYTGMTKSRTDKYTEGNKHSRHYDNEKQNGLRKVRSSKHRYVYFCTNSKRIKNEWINALRYPVLPYPKGQNKNYTLGSYLEPKIVNQE